MVRRKRQGNRVFPKRSTLWVLFEVSLAMTTAGTVVASADLLGNYFGQTGEEVPIGSTIGPVRGTLSLASTAGNTADADYRLEMAMQMTREGGRATLPSPGTDIMDAMWYGQFSAPPIQQEISSGVFSTPASKQELLTNAMRKITGNGQQLQIFAVPSGNTDFTLTAIGVLMLKLP